MIELDNVVQELKAEAEAAPLTYDKLMAALGSGQMPKEGIPNRWVTLEGVRIKVQFSRVNLLEDGKYSYLLSIGNETGKITEIPESVVITVRDAFLNSPMSLTSLLGNSIQFLELVVPPTEEGERW